MKVVTPATGRATHRQRTGSRLTPAGAALVLVIVVLLFALAVPVRTLMEQRSDLARLQKEERLLSQQNGALSRQIARLHDPAYLERIARECLGMTKPGEISFVVVPRGGSNADRDGSASGGLSDPTSAC
jgi:cell division protein FtsB